MSSSSAALHAISRCANVRLSLRRVLLFAVATLLVAQCFAVMDGASRRLAQLAGIERLAGTESDAGASDAGPECGGERERAEIDDIDFRRKLVAVDGAVPASEASPHFSEAFMRARFEDRRRCRPPNAGV